MRVAWAWRRAPARAAVPAPAPARPVETSEAQDQGTVKMYAHALAVPDGKPERVREARGGFRSGS